MLVVWVIQEKRCSFWCGVPGGDCGGMPVCQSGQLFNCGLFCGVQLLAHFIFLFCAKSEKFAH